MLVGADPAGLWRGLGYVAYRSVSSAVSGGGDRPTAVRFAVTGGYELTSAAAWQYASGVCGIVVAGLALYAALATEIDSATRRSLLPLLRPAYGRRAVSGLGREAGVRQQL